MTKEELFKKYSIDKSHDIWDDRIDNWMSVELFRFMHGGRLPNTKDVSLKYITDFLDKQKDGKWWVANVMVRGDWGSLYLTAKRMVCRYFEALVDEINAQE